MFLCLVGAIVLFSYFKCVQIECFEQHVSE